MRRAVLNRFNPNYRTEYEAVERTYEFWKLYDLLKHGSCSKIFARLYMQEDRFTDTQVKLSLSLGVGERTLLRYRKLFVQSFVYILEEVKQESQKRSAH